MDGSGYDFPNPTYSPDSVASDFHLFSSIKSYLKGKRFQDDGALISEDTFSLALYLTHSGRDDHPYTQLLSFLVRLYPIHLCFLASLLTHIQ